MFGGIRAKKIVRFTRYFVPVGSHRGSNASSGQQQQFGHHRSSTASLAAAAAAAAAAESRDRAAAAAAADYLDYPPPPPQRAASSAGGQVLGGADLVAAMAATLKRSSREKLDNVQQGGEIFGQSLHGYVRPCHIPRLQYYGYTYLLTWP